MRSGKQFVRAGLVMALDPCGLVDVTGRFKCLRKPFLYSMGWCKTCRGLMCGCEVRHNCLTLLVVKKFNTIRQLYA